ncbi:urease accessory protein UreH [Caldalkalibacillus uzonensis]|uniref:Urease accessory protein UreH n=1 Tax=Caldalkalibacillus uzonensis TaxID=353224 RepID=A0ABU0CQX8_9BACI|nr:urease accessory protein UreD [Caldalkalibacillus uzonensis]MDQ0338826.1 urease accessory protein UreH [Caldalkalibacillus uzonensis]
METYIQNGDIRDRQSLLTYLRHYLLWAEILAPGRLRHQERFAYHFVKIVFDVWKREGTSAEEWISHDSFSWDRNTGDIQGIGVLDGCLYLGTMWFFSPVAKQMDERLWHEKLQRPDMKAGVTRTEADGLHFRWLAADGLVLKQQMERVWHQLKEMVSATHQF